MRLQRAAFCLQLIPLLFCANLLSRYTNSAPAAVMTVGALGAVENLDNWLFLFRLFCAAIAPVFKIGGVTRFASASFFGESILGAVRESKFHGRNNDCFSKEEVVEWGGMFLFPHSTNFLSHMRKLSLLGGIVSYRPATKRTSATMIVVGSQRSVIDRLSTIKLGMDSFLRSGLLKVALFTKHLALFQFNIQDTLAHRPVNRERLCGWIDVIHFKVFARPAEFARSIFRDPFVSTTLAPRHGLSISLSFL